MEKIVQEDLKYIPKDKHNDCQSILRNVYSNNRRHGLKHGKTKEQALACSLKGMKQNNPDCQPIYDMNYFNRVEVEKLMETIENDWGPLKKNGFDETGLAGDMAILGYKFGMELSKDEKKQKKQGEVAD